MKKLGNQIFIILAPISFLIVIRESDDLGNVDFFHEIYRPPLVVVMSDCIVSVR